MLGDHGTPDSKFLLLHLLVFFLQLSYIPPQPPDLPKLLPSLILFPKHTQRLLFVAVCAFLWHPQSSWSSSSYSNPPQRVGRTKPVLPWLLFFSALKPALCFQLPIATCVAGFNKPWQAPSTSFWLGVGFFLMFMSHYSANEWPLSRETVDKISPHYFQRNWLVNWLVLRKLGKAVLKILCFSHFGGRF